MVGRGSNSASARGGDSMTEEQKRERKGTKTEVIG